MVARNGVRAGTGGEAPTLLLIPRSKVRILHGPLAAYSAGLLFAVAVPVAVAGRVARLAVAVAGRVTRLAVAGAVARLAVVGAAALARSEERRVGKECRS